MWSRTLNTSQGSHRNFPLPVFLPACGKLLRACTCKDLSVWTFSDPQPRVVSQSDGVPLHNLQLRTTNVLRLIWALSLPTPTWVDVALKAGIRSTACLMGWSVPKASDSASAGMARYQHWLPCLGKTCSHCGINISTICLTPDWSSHEEHEPGVYNSLSPCWFESTEGCISSIEKVPSTVRTLGLLTRRGISITSVIQQKWFNL